MARIYAIFKRALGPQLQDEPDYSEEYGYSAFDASNRYFTLRSAKDHDEECPISEDMDPKGYLRKAAGGMYIHTEDNRVRYYEKCQASIGG